MQCVMHQRNDVVLACGQNACRLAHRILQLPKQEQGDRLVAHRCLDRRPQRLLHCIGRCRAAAAGKQCSHAGERAQHANGCDVLHAAGGRGRVAVVQCKACVFGLELEAVANRRCRGSCTNRHSAVRAISLAIQIAAVTDGVGMSVGAHVELCDVTQRAAGQVEALRIRHAGEVAALNVLWA